jgi:sorting nexin-1/2
MKVKKGEVDSADEEDEEEQVTTPKASKKSTIKKWIKDKKTCLSGTLHRSPLDPLFDEMEHYVSALENGLKRVELEAEHMVKNCERESNMWMEFGLGCDAVGHVDDFIGQSATTSSGSAPNDDCDEGNETIGQRFHTTSQTADALCTLYKKHQQALLLHFLLPLRDHLKIVHAAKSALTKRANRRITYSTALSNVDSKKALLHKYRITQGMENKILNAEASLSKVEIEMDTAKKSYDEVSDRVLREFDRFRAENAIMMHQTMMEFGRFQCEHSRKCMSGISLYQPTRLHRSIWILPFV